MNIRILIVIVVALGLAACTKARDERTEHGAALLAPFKTELQAALRQGLADGPAGAITACRVDAPRIAGSLSVDGVVMGRSSHKLRNPANAAPGWLGPVLDSYVDGSAGLAPQVVDLDDGRSGYAEPIMTQSLCLTCHGKELHPDVVERVKELYPEDQAIGFNAGDFRGVFWVEF